MHIGLHHSWPLVLPMVIIFAYVALFHREAAKRMGDMSGYTTREKIAAVSASLSPYPFMALTLFTPFTAKKAALSIGALLYASGFVGFLFAVMTYTKTCPHEPAMNGIYKISRNPMYVSALLMFAGITIMTFNITLVILLFLIILLHHKMILAEERACDGKFTGTYEQYRRITPRYLFK